MNLPNTKQACLRLTLVSGLFLFCLSQFSQADTSLEAAKVGGILDAVDQNYKNLQLQWYTVIKSHAQWLFWALVMIDFGWSSVVYALEKQDISEIIVSIVKKIFPIGFFWMLLTASDTWIPAIINSFIMIGQNSTGQGELSPSTIISDGADLFFSSYTIMRDLNTLEAFAVVLPITIVSFTIFCAMLYVAFQLLMANIEMYIVCGGGVILLGFGGSRWTTDFATKYLQYSLSVGIKYLVIYLIVGGGKTLISNMTINPDNLIPSMITLLGTVLIFAGLVFNIPKIASGMASGQAQLSAGSAFQAMVAVTAATAGAAAVGMAGAKAATTIAKEGLAGGGGLAKALGAGLKAAVDLGKSGMSAAAHATGEVAKHGLGLGVDALGSAVKGAQSGFSDMVNQSTGGKIASSIEASRGGSLSSGSSSSGSSSASQNGSSSPTASSNGSGDKASATPASAGTSQDTNAVPSAPPSKAASSSSAAGNASGATISGSGPAQPENQPTSPYKPPLHERIKSLEGYVPQDDAAIQVGNIQTGHTRD